MSVPPNEGDESGGGLFRGLLEAAPDAMVISDERGRIVLVNGQAERLFGYGRDELLGQPLELLVPEGVREAHRGHRERYGADPRTRPMGDEARLTARRKDGSELPVEISLAPLRTESGVLVTAAVRDVTARRAAEVAVRDAYRELETFSHAVAHDLRAPLRGILAFAHILKEESGERLDAEGLESLREITDNAERMVLLVDALLSLARVASTELTCAEVDLSALARSVGSSLAAEHGGSNGARRVELVVGDTPKAHIDPRLARTLVRSLLDNAWKFTGGRAEARVEFGCLSVDGQPTWFVRDNGSGFDMDFAERLFQPFQRLHTAREFPGTGMGLATAHRIVRRHGGRIWAEGEPGAGATISFTLGGQGQWPA